MTNVLIHDSRRLLLPLDTMVDALIEFDHAHKRWPERATPQSARLIPTGVALSVRQPGQDSPVERTYSLAIIAAAIIHYCSKMHVPVPKNASKSVSITSEGVTMLLEGTLLLQRQHRELPHHALARPRAAEPEPEQVSESAAERAPDPVLEPAPEQPTESAAEVPGPVPSDSSPAAQPNAASTGL